MPESDALPAVAPQPSPAQPSLPTQPMRDRAIELLTQHYANDGIALEEFERRTSAVFAARSADELSALVADVARPALPATIPEHGRISAILSSNEQRGTMIVPHHLEVVAIFGNAELDLRDASFGDGVTIIEVRCTFGNVELTLPAEVRVEMAGETIFGSFTSFASAPPAGTPMTRVVRITGRAVFGNVEAMTVAPRLPAELLGQATAPR